MTVGVGGSTAEAELAAMKSMRGDVPPIGVAERLHRRRRAQGNRVVPLAGSAGEGAAASLRAAGREPFRELA